MKIRNDYVSNSSSSSFIVYGSKVTGTLKPEDFEKLGKDEAYFVINKDAGSEGDYIYPITPNIMMDCDMHQVQLDSNIFDIVKAKYIGGEYSMTTAAARSKMMTRKYDKNPFGLDDDYDLEVSDSDSEKLRSAARLNGLSLDGLTLFEYDLDYGSPRYKNEMMENMSHCMEQFRAETAQ